MYWCVLIRVALAGHGARGRLLWKRRVHWNGESLHVMAYKHSNNLTITSHRHLEIKWVELACFVAVRTLYWMARYVCLHALSYVQQCWYHVFYRTHLGQTIVQTGCIIRGDLANINIGRQCVIGASTVITPPFRKLSHGWAEMTVSQIILFLHPAGSELIPPLFPWWHTVY